MQYRLSTLFLLFVVLWTSLATFGVGGIVVFLVALGVAICLRRSESIEAAIATSVLIACATLVLLGSLMPAVARAPGAVRRMQCTSNLKQLAMALYNYNQANGCFPPAYVADKDGRPMHSWRVLIWPYLEGETGYKQYRFDEPWDGPNNKKLLAARPRVFCCPGGEKVNPQGNTETSYVAVVGDNAAWAGEKPQSLKDFGSKSSETILLIEAADAGIQWTEPKDLSLDALEASGARPPKLTASSRHGIHKDFLFTYQHPSGLNVAMADGSVQWLSPGVTAPERLRTLLKVGGCKEENLQNLVASRDEYRELNWDNIVALIVWLLSVGWLLYRAVRSRKRPGGLAVAMTVGETEAPMNADESRPDQSSRGGKPRSGGSQ
ncbi:MAG: DUF1559 domain-containing protein [Thermoguttaceae bacterium]